jgi:hypothetical protein
MTINRTLLKQILNRYDFIQKKMENSTNNKILGGGGILSFQNFKFVLYMILSIGASIDLNNINQRSYIGYINEIITTRCDGNYYYSLTGKPRFEEVDKIHRNVCADRVYIIDWALFVLNRILQPGAAIYIMKRLFKYFTKQPINEEQFTNQQQLIYQQQQQVIQQQQQVIQQQLQQLYSIVINNPSSQLLPITSAENQILLLQNSISDTIRPRQSNSRPTSFLDSASETIRPTSRQFNSRPTEFQNSKRLSRKRKRDESRKIRSPISRKRKRYDNLSFSPRKSRKLNLSPIYHTV